MASTALARERLELENKAAQLSLRQRAASLRAAADKATDLAKVRVKAALEDGRTNVAVGAGARTAGIFAEAFLKKKLDPKYHKAIGPMAAVAAVAAFTLAMSSKKPKDVAMYNAAGSVAEGVAARFFVSIADDFASNMIKE